MSCLEAHAATYETRTVDDLRSYVEKWDHKLSRAPSISNWTVFTSAVERRDPAVFSSILGQYASSLTWHEALGSLMNPAYFINTASYASSWRQAAAIQSFIFRKERYNVQVCQEPC